MIHIRQKVNEQNLRFYNNLTIDPFKLLAQIGGFDTYNDMEIVFPYQHNSKSILEIGAGYGRCIEFLLSKKYLGDIIAVEQSPKLATYLSHRYKNFAQIIEGNINSFHLNKTVDAAMWMWSGLIDFSYYEQEESIKRISSMLSPGGLLIIDVPLLGFKTIGYHEDEKNISFETSYGNLKCFIPDVLDIQHYSKTANMELYQQFVYLTSTEKKRKMYILKKLAA